MKFKLTFTEPVLGSQSGNKDLATEFIASKHPEGVQPDEAAAIENMDENLEKASTVFAKDHEGNLHLWDYQVKGFFKSACEAMLDSGAFTQETLKKMRLTRYLYKKTIDKMIFPGPRRIYLMQEVPAKPTICERPLRGETMKGERIALARSEQLPAGTHFDMTIALLNQKLEPFIRPWLTYGKLLGLGQWRSSGMGRFSWEELEHVDEAPHSDWKKLAESLK